MKLLGLLCVVVAFACVGVAGAEEPTPVDMFASGDFSEWGLTPGGKGWRLENGVVHRHQLHAGSLVSKRRYRDFELDFEFKISPGGNSGVIYRRQKGGGLEYQVLDDKRHRAGKRADGRTAALYNLVAPRDERPRRPAGEWNTDRIVAVGDHIEHWLNGELVVEVDMTGKDWSRRYQTSKYGKHDRESRFGKVASSIVLQDHGGEVWYRSVMIRDLEPADPIKFNQFFRPRFRLLIGSTQHRMRFY